MQSTNTVLLLLGRCQGHTRFCRAFTVTRLGTPGNKTEMQAGFRDHAFNQDLKPSLQSGWESLGFSPPSRQRKRVRKGHAAGLTFVTVEEMSDRTNRRSAGIVLAKPPPNVATTASENQPDREEKSGLGQQAARRPAPPLPALHLPSPSRLQTRNQPAGPLPSAALTREGPHSLLGPASLLYKALPPRPPSGKSDP